MSIIHERFKQVRISKGYSVDDFAKLLDIHRSSIYRYEGTNQKEQRDIPFDVAIKISQKFNISLEWLAGLTDKKEI